MKEKAANVSAPILPSSFRPSRVRYAVMAFLCVLSFLTYFDRVCIVRAQGEMQHDLHLSDEQFGLVLGAFWLAYALFEIPSGFLGDRYGARGTLTRIVMAWSCFTALSGSATGFVSLLTFRFLFGAGEAGAYPNMARIQGAWLPEKSRARAGGLLWLCARWGGAFSPIIFGSMLRAFSAEPFRRFVAGTFLEHIATWRLGFFASGLLGAIWVICFWPWFRDNPAHKRSVNAAELDLITQGKTNDPTSRRLLRSRISPAHQLPPRAPGLFMALFTSPSLWAIAGLYICASFGWSFFVSWMPRFLKDVHGVTFAKSEWMSGLPLFFGGIACLVGGLLSDALVRRSASKRLARAVLPVSGYFVASLAMLSIRFVHSPQAATVLLCLAAGAFDFGQGANWATIVDIGGRYAGTATGFINTVGNLGNSAQPVIGAWIFNTFGWNALFVTYAAAFLVAASMWLFINPNHRFYSEPASEPQGFEILPNQ